MAEFFQPEAQVHAVGFRARFANVGFEAVWLRFGYRQRVVFARRDFGRPIFGTAAGMDVGGGSGAAVAVYARSVRCTVAGTDTGFQTACGGLGGKRAAVARGGGSGRTSAAVPQRRGILACGAGAACAADGRGMVYRAPEVQGGGIRRCRHDAGSRACRPLRQVRPIQRYARRRLRLCGTHRRICGFIGGKAPTFCDGDAPRYGRGMAAVFGFAAQRPSESQRQAVGRRTRTNWGGQGQRTGHGWSVTGVM